MNPVLAMLVSATVLVVGQAEAQTVQERLNDYPTAARADYVFGCMAANGQTRTALFQCSCSIDIIASILPYENYVEAETVLSMQQVGGERMAIFRTAAMARSLVSDLRRAQAEAEIRCF
jgi:lysyl-tRNA synthetase class II